MRFEKTLENTIVERCISTGITLVVAESCTGGLIAHRITNVPGASAIFKGGVVAYANAVKVRLLGVPEDALATQGAVSEAVALAMAQGARRSLNADCSVAVTGIAGPGGGSPEKPVGTVYVAAADASGARARLHHFSGDRASIKQQTADAALSLLAELLEVS